MVLISTGLRSDDNLLRPSAPDILVVKSSGRAFSLHLLWFTVATTRKSCPKVRLFVWSVEPSIFKNNGQRTVCLSIRELQSAERYILVVERGAYAIMLA